MFLSVKQSAAKRSSKMAHANARYVRSLGRNMERPLAQQGLYRIVVIHVVIFGNVVFIYVLQHTELQFYGATILHSKLLKDWSEIPVDQYENLKVRLLEAVVYFKNGSKVVLNRLCISVRCEQHVQISFIVYQTEFISLLFLISVGCFHTSYDCLFLVECSG